MLTRDGDKLKVTQPAEHPKLEDYKLDDVGRALENLTFQDVKPDKEPIGDKVGEAVFSHLRRAGGHRHGHSSRQGFLGPFQRRRPRARQTGSGHGEREARRLGV